jgi:flagellar basal-body rod modification protein FlgD
MGMANTIDSSLMLSRYKDEQRKTGSDILGKDDFLKILMIQLQNQDPTNPIEDKDFIAQMATFSSLEQMTNMSKSMDKFVSMQEQNTLVTYSQFVGKEVKWHSVTEQLDSEGEPVIEEGTGKVASIQFKDNNAIFILEDGKELTPANISEVTGTSQESNLVEASMLIGKLISYKDKNGLEQRETVKSVIFKDGKTLFQLVGGGSASASQITQIE